MSFDYTGRRQCNDWHGSSEAVEERMRPTPFSAPRLWLREFIVRVVFAIATGLHAAGPR